MKNKSHKIKHKFRQQEINLFWKRIQLKFPIFNLFPCCNPVRRENLRHMAWLGEKVWYQIWLKFQFSLKCTMILTPMLIGQNVVSQILDFLSHNTTHSFSFVSLLPLCAMMLHELIILLTFFRNRVFTWYG